ncbi:MAG: Co(2+)/Mg(2+) efflux protein ApaG [Verrucomicrobiota bacterium]
MESLSELIEVPGLKVTVDRLLYQRLRADQSDKPHSFIYFISIHNQSPVPVTIRGRKWVVTHEDETVLVVEGDGVVGETPEIPPGGKFSYNSRHIIGTPSAVAEGSYLGVDDAGRRIVVRIPRFRMEVPGAREC